LNIGGFSSLDSVFVDGNDSLAGGSGTDVMFAEDGDDILNGDSGIDLFNGGQGLDTLGNRIQARLTLSA
jgi:Ca2+-binding RTX toxin-like protein